MANMDSAQRLWPHQGVVLGVAWLLFLGLNGLTLPLNAAEESGLRTITVKGLGESVLERSATGLIVEPRTISTEKLAEAFGVPVKMTHFSTSADFQDGKANYELSLDPAQVASATQKLEALKREFEVTKLELIPGPMPETAKESRHQALEKALFNAKEKAELLARTYDMIVDEPVSITEKSLETNAFGVVAVVEVTFEMR
jgi:hypothetical protein